MLSVVDYDILNGHIDYGFYEEYKLLCPECDDGKIIYYIDDTPGFNAKEYFPCKICGYEHTQD